MKKEFWILTENHIYNKDVINCKVYVKKFGRGKVFLLDNEHFSFTCSFGTNSDFSFSGSFYGIDCKNLELCKAALDSFVPAWLKGTNNTKSASDYLKQGL